MCEVERNRDAGNTTRREPLIRKPCVGTNQETPRAKLVKELLEAPLEPCPLDAEIQVLEAQLQQPLGGPLGPRAL